MSTFIRARCLFLLHVGAGCQALSLGRPRAHHKGRHAQHERPSAQPLDGQIPNVSDNKSECVTWKMNGGGRLGNQFSGLATALFEAEMCGRSCVASTDLQRKVFSNLFNLPRVITLVDPLSKSDVCKQAIAHREWSKGFWAEPPPLNWTKIVFNKYLTPLLTASNHLLMKEADNDDTLVVHLRGGDILNEKRNYNDYMPAPCSFYQRAMRQGRHDTGYPFQHVIVVSDSTEHPCLGMIGDNAHPNQRLTKVVVEQRAVGTETNQLLRTEYVQASQADDFMLLVSGRHIALSTSSTFGFSGIMMNPHERIQVFMPTYAGAELCCDGNYKAERLAELCSFGPDSKIFEIPFPQGYKTRLGWLRSKSTIDDASTVIHTCGAVQ